MPASLGLCNLLRVPSVAWQIKRGLCSTNHHKKNFQTNGRLCKDLGGKSNVEIDAETPAVTALQVSLQSDLELSKLSV